jgi:ribulose-5-phosphate 4-epimerase/fuculose-1-phosphate aldolase
MSVTQMRSSRMADAEWQTRVDLAACYRLVDLFGWSDLINTRITARVPGPHDHFLINRFGMLYDEITASSLLKIDAAGNKVEPSGDEINSGGFALPSTIHMARPDINCVIHTHTIAGCAVSMQKDGLLPLNQHALQVIGDIAYHDYEGSGRSTDERQRFLADFGDKHIMVLRNHGLFIIGRTIAEAFTRPTGWSAPARCSSLFSSRALRSTRCRRRWSAPATPAPIPAPPAATTPTNTIGRRSCANSTA